MAHKFLFYLNVNAKGNIGIFAAQDVPKGAYLPIFAQDDYHLWRKSTIAKLAAGTEHLLGMCVLDSSGAHGPKDFNRPSIGWYIRNSGEEGPTAFHKNYKFYAARDIAAGEEVTVDVTTLGDERYPPM